LGKFGKVNDIIEQFIAQTRWVIPPNTARATPVAIIDACFFVIETLAVRSYGRMAMEIHIIVPLSYHDTVF
jgi:hypothetical protein